MRNLFLRGLCTAALLAAARHSAAAGNFFDRFEISPNIVSFGGGMNLPSLHQNQPEKKDEQYNFEMAIALGEFFIEHKTLHFGFEYELIRFSGYFHRNSDLDIDKFYFLNPGLYWNLLFRNNIILGPFVSANYLVVENFMYDFTDGQPFRFNQSRDSQNPYNLTALKLNEFLFSAGIRFLWRIGWKTFFLPKTVKCEIGYRNHSGRSGFFAGLGFSAPF
ncbi:MAG: hypothetical protein LBG42_00510 [Treponema sp.]|jgi:hypothetical protein|nr:hypothetical protein [Treponema sp.]